MLRYGVLSVVIPSRPNTYTRHASQCRNNLLVDLTLGHFAGKILFLVWADQNKCCTFRKRSMLTQSIHKLTGRIDDKVVHVLWIASKQVRGFFDPIADSEQHGRAVL